MANTEVSIEYSDRQQHGYENQTVKYSHTPKQGKYLYPLLRQQRAQNTVIPRNWAKMDEDNH